MCGIAGYVHTQGVLDPDSVIERMTDSISHRGPDDSGFYRDSFASLGHRRLSIIDLATGHQPICNEDGSLWIVYNGEVFNHAQIRKQLEKAGHRYKTSSDTETILHAYEEYGPDCVSHLRGMFAFVIWDKNSRSLFCARDRLGIKPFYYYWDGRLFVFASEIKALLEHPSVSPRLEEQLVPEYLAFGYVSEERTLFANVRTLMPGYSLRLNLKSEASRLEFKQYWDVPPPDSIEAKDDDTWIRECRSRLEESIQLRLMSDVPLGMFLSGGVDSSAIAALMKRMVSEPIQTFAVGYQESQFSELGYARHVAQSIGTDHHEVLVSRKEFFDALPGLIWHEDEPIFWPSSLALYFVSRLASKHVKVVLTGEGSDELFAGYDRYRYYFLNRRFMNFYRLVPAPLRAWIRSQVANSPLLAGSLGRKLRHSFVGRTEDLESLQLDNFYCAFSQAEQHSLLAPSSVLYPSPYANFLRYWNSVPQRPLLARMLYTDLKAYLVELLMKQDQMSMACSIESRVPFLDHHFVEFAVRVPDRLKLRGGIDKYILRKAVEDLLPPKIVYRKKAGFPTPYKQWMTGPGSEGLFATLRDPDGLLASYLNRSVLDDLIASHQTGKEDATDRLWRLLNLQLWGDIFLLGRREKGWEQSPLVPHFASSSPGRATLFKQV